MNIVQAQASTFKLIVFIIVGFAGGYFIRGFKATQIIQKEVRKSERTEAIAEHLRIQNDSLKIVVDSVNEIADDTPIPARRHIRIHRIIDTLLVNVPDTVRVEIAAAIDTLVVERDSLRAACTACEKARLQTINLYSNLYAEKDSLWSLNKSLNLALSEATMPPPWYKSDFAYSIYGAITIKLIEGIF